MPRHTLGEREDGEPVASWHRQNLNERRDGTTGPGWRHGRAWLHWYGRRQELSRLTLGVEWVLLRPDAGFKVGLERCSDDDDYDLSTTLALPFLGALYFNVEGLFPLRWQRDGKSFSIQLYQEYLWVEFFWTDPAWTLGKNKNRFPAFRLSLDWQSLLFGKRQHRLEHMSGDWGTIDNDDWRDITIPMPEGSYPARYRIERRTWWRKRWPRKLVRVSADIDIPGGVPVPGKGENSWDCGEDAIFGMGSSDISEPGIIAAVVKSALETRQRYASLSWRPKEPAR